MRDLPGRAHFVVKLRQPLRVFPHVVWQELQRDWLAEPQVVGAIHLAHAAPAEHADDAVAAVEHGAGRKASVADGIGGRQPAVRRRRRPLCRNWIRAA